MQLAAQLRFICRHHGVSWEAINSATVGIAAQPDAGLGCCAAGPPRGGVDVALAAEARAALLPAEAGLALLLLLAAARPRDPLPRGAAAAGDRLAGLPVAGLPLPLPPSAALAPPPLSGGSAARR